MDFIIGKIAALKTFFIVAVISFIAGGVGAAYTMHKFEQAELVQEAQKTAQKSEKSIDKSDQIEAAVADKKSAVEIRYKTITKEIPKYVAETTVKECKSADGSTIATTLNVGAVSLLNDGDEGAGVQPTDSPESKAATEVGLRELSEYIVDIKKRYQDLAIDHDALMDYNDYYKSLIKQ